MSAADATATADHNADLAALLAAGKRCKVCAPAVPRDGVRGPVPTYERAGIGLLTQVGDRIELRLYSKKLDDGRYTYLKSVRVVEVADLSGFELLQTLPPLPAPPEAPCTRDAASLPISLTLTTAIALVRPSYNVVPGETQQSGFGGAASEQPLGILSGSIVVGQVNRDRGWGMVAELMSLVGEGGQPGILRTTWETAATDEHGAIVLCSAAASIICVIRNGLFTLVVPLMCNIDVLDAVLALAEARALHFDDLLAHAVGLCHPWVADKALPVATGWIGVAEKTLALLLLQTDTSLLGKLRGPFARLVRECLLNKKSQGRAAKR